MKPVPHGEPYAGKLHVRFDEGADVPCGGVSPYSTILQRRAGSRSCKEQKEASLHEPKVEPRGFCSIPVEKAGCEP